MIKSVSLPLVLFDVQPIAFPVQKVSLEMKVYKSRRFTQHFQNVDLQSFLITTRPSTNRIFWINRLAFLLTSCGLSWSTASIVKIEIFPTLNHHHHTQSPQSPSFLITMITTPQIRAILFSSHLFQYFCWSLDWLSQMSRGRELCTASSWKTHFSILR